ncbi:MAG: flavodoxin-dependent (E)-4-hydroxy-3-methylbut-2-enyl-diphosphate synthase [bacterium]
MIKRRKTRKIFVGNVGVGGDSPVSIQSMTNTDTKDVRKTLNQIKRLYKAGCEIIRVAVPDEEACEALKQIVGKSPIPVIADIHFDYKLAVNSIKNGVHCIRINPGNIKNPKKLEEIIKTAKDYDCAIRIGVNAGSLDYSLKRQYEHDISKALVESALNFVNFFEGRGFSKLKVSLKSTDVLTTVAAYEAFSKVSDIPLHLGITEAGTKFAGTIRSSIGIGHLLLKGIGDTLRVSLTSDPVDEVVVAKEILKSLGLRDLGPVLISCPTCARREIDVIALAKKVEKELSYMTANIKVAVMGCPVNGPGEAMEADIGVAGSKRGGIIFKKGKVINKIDNFDKLVKSFISELRKIEDDWRKRKI